MKSTNFLTIGDYIPNFNLKSFGGSNFSISEIIGKNNLVIHFFKSIKDCSSDNNSFSNFIIKLNTSNTKFIAISNKVDSPIEPVRELGENFNLLNDERNELRSFFGLPQPNSLSSNNVTFVVDCFGKIKAKMENDHDDISRMDIALQILENLKEVTI